MFLFIWWLRWWSIGLQCRRPKFDPWVRNIPWRPTPVFLPGEFTEEPDRPQSMGLQRVRHDWATATFLLIYFLIIQFSSVQSLSRVQLFATPWIAACQASLSITSSGSSLRLTSIKSVIPSSHLVLCRPLLLLPPIPPSIRVFSNESALHMRWPKYWSFSFSISPSILAVFKNQILKSLKI